MDHHRTGSWGFFVDLQHFAGIFLRDIYPCFYHDNCINFGLGLFSFFLKCFLVICFCSAYLMPLFGLCPRFLDPAPDNVSHYLI